MKYSDIKELTDSELEHQHEEMLKEQLNLRIQARTGQIENTARLRQVRRDIARINTEKRNRVRDAEKNQQKELEENLTK